MPCGMATYIAWAKDDAKIYLLSASDRDTVNCKLAF